MEPEDHAMGLMAAQAGLQAARQIAYIVPDVREAIRRHNAIFGSGPYFLGEGFTLADHLYRGERWSLDIDAALGQWGDVQIELIQLNDDRANIFREGPGRDVRGPRLHHLCLHPESVEDAIAMFAERGCPLVFEFAMPLGTRSVIIDTLAELGHFVELYGRTDEVVGIYDNIRSAAESFDGSELIRPLGVVFESITQA